MYRTKLVFDSRTQILIKIDFYRLGQIYLRYGHVTLFRECDSATFMAVYNVNISEADLCETERNKVPCT